MFRCLKGINVDLRLRYINSYIDKILNFWFFIDSCRIINSFFGNYWNFEGDRLIRVIQIYLFVKNSFVCKISMFISLFERKV